MSGPVQKAADLAAAGSLGVAGATWYAPFSEPLQIIATVVAIVAGIFAIAAHYKTLRRK